MLKIFTIFCLILISRMVSGGGGAHDGTLTTAQMEESSSRVKNFTTGLSGMAGVSTEFLTTRLEPIITSYLPTIPEQYRGIVITILKEIVVKGVPGGQFAVPIFDRMAKQYESTDKLKEFEKTIPQPADTTDVLLYKLMVEDIDGYEKLQQFMNIGANSALVKQVLGSFLVSLKSLVDAYVTNFGDKMEDNSDRILKDLMWRKNF